MLDKVNPELLYAFDIREAEERQKSSGIKVMLPFRVEVTNSNWQPYNIPDYTELGRMQTIIGVFGSRKTVYALQRDARVLSIG